MAFPNSDKLKKIRSKLEKADPSRTLPKNATTAQKVKYKLCEKFVNHIIPLQLERQN